MVLLRLLQKRLWKLACMVLLISATWSDANEFRKYSFSSLDSFWQEMLPPPQVEVYRAVLTNNGSEPKDDQAAVLHSRELSLHLYLSRDSSHDLSGLVRGLEGAEQAELLSKRRLSAVAELAIIKLARFRYANSSRQKCTLQKQAVANSATVQRFVPEEDGANALKEAFPSDRSGLADEYLWALGTFEAQLKASSPCTIALSSESMNPLSEIQSTVNKMVSQKLDAEINGTGGIVEAISNQQSSVRGMQDRVSTVDPLSAELLDLEEKISNYRGNLDFVHTDALDLAQFHDELAKIDFEKEIAAALSRETLHPASAIVSGDMAQLAELISKNLDDIAVLGQALGISDSSLGCNSLALISVQLRSREDGSIAAANYALEKCYSEIETRVQSLRDEYNQLETLGAIFANSLSELSSRYVEIREGESQ